MAIIQISKIQHRRGVSTDLPQLASAELGWSIDTRQLYIGNGTIEEGAPSLGNTEILTEHSDILSAVQTYTLKGDAGGYRIRTGSTSAAPITRTLQAKLDDIIDVRDFGATGDGVTDDTAAINRALYEVYCRAPNNTLSRRSLYFPAGTYIITGGVVKVPTYANLIGDGSSKTYIVQTDGTQDCVLKTADSSQNIDSNLGSGGSALPSNISLLGFTLYNTSAKPVAILTTASLIKFADVVFQGGQTNPASAGTISSVVLNSLSSPSVLPTSIIDFSQCGFVNCTYGLSVDDSNISDINFSSCVFVNLYQAIKLGELTALDPKPTGFRISNSLFDKIYSSAISTYSATTGIYSINNRFKDVGNSFLGVENPSYPVIHYRDDECYSIGDQFDRPDTDILDYPLIERGTTTGGPRGLNQGRQTIGSGVTVVLSNDTTGAIAQFTALNSQIEYTITRGTSYRNGVIKVMSNLSTVYYDDEYVGDDCSTTLAVTTDGLKQSFNFVTDNTGPDATMLYSIKYFS
jgi:hypothetical protein